MNEPTAPPFPQTREEIRSRFGEVVRQFRAPLISFLQRYVGDEQSAADLAQETFVKSYFQLERFDDRRPFHAWLFTIAANGARDHIRKHFRSPLISDEEASESASEQPAPDRVMEARESREALDSAIALLPITLREPILLHYQLDWPVAEIARHLGIDQGAVKTRLHRARQRLHTLLTPWKKNA